MTRFSSTVSPKRPVEPLLGAGGVGDLGDAADPVAGLALEGRRPVRVGDVVLGEDRVADRLEAGELVGVADLLAGGAEVGGLLGGQVVGEVVDERRAAGIGAVDGGAPAERVVRDPGEIGVVVGDGGDLLEWIVDVGGAQHLGPAVVELVHRRDQRPARRGTSPS